MSKVQHKTEMLKQTGTLVLFLIGEFCERLHSVISRKASLLYVSKIESGCVRSRAHMTISPVLFDATGMLDDRYLGIQGIDIVENRYIAETVQ